MDIGMRSMGLAGAGRAGALLAGLIVVIMLACTLVGFRYSSMIFAVLVPIAMMQGKGTVDRRCGRFRASRRIQGGRARQLGSGVLTGTCFMEFDPRHAFLAFYRWNGMPTRLCRCTAG